MVGEFEKPRYFGYKASICAHSRSQKPGCNRCIDVCSTEAISADGDHVKVEPHLCMGCGACATECPSGAMTYAYPSVPDLAKRLRTLLSTYEKAGGRDAVLLLHAADGRDVVAQAARRGGGLPARVIPFEVHHIASVGLNLWLAALAWGASQVAVLATGTEAPEYHAAIAHQMRVADAIAQGLGYQGEHFRLIDGADPIAFASSLRGGSPALAVRVAATFAGTPEKRTTAALAIEHLAANAPVPRKEIPLPAGAPSDHRRRRRRVHDVPRLRRLLSRSARCRTGRRCWNSASSRASASQCGLCRETCPEHAISLSPRLNLAADAKVPRVLNAAVTFNCIRCGKPMGTDKMIGNMVAKLAGHSMFAKPGALDRLKMCADCRVVDLMQNEGGLDIRDTGPAR